jgi:protein-L-isoaspartate O-methyltransferase
LFCEWGSGFGVVAALAAMLEFDVCGIEIEGELLDASRQLAEDFDLPVDLVHGSFIPEGAQAFTEQAYSNSSSDWAWIVTDADDAYDELGLEPDDFDVIFAYPWPGEESVLSGLFERVAAEGALLLTYNQFDSVRLRRKVSRRRRR